MCEGHTFQLGDATKPCVSEQGLEVWEEQIKLFCDVVAAAADRVLVVTCDANRFPAFEYSPLHGRRLRARAQYLQREAAQLPAARAAKRIRAAVIDNAVVILEGQTGSGKSTQVPQIALDLLWCRRLSHRKVVHVCPLIEPLRCLHRRLEDEMDASGQIQLATGRVSRLGKVIGSC